MKQNWKTWGTRAGATTLSVLLLTSCLVPAASAAVDPVLDEAYYGTLNYFGALTEGSVVKSYRTNGNTVISDTGAYDEVVNLTDRTEAQVDGDQVTFDLGEDAPENFYFEGKTSAPFEEMPFTIQLSYRMNGVDTEPEDMAGQTGVGEIILDIYPSKNASEYAQNNFALEAMTVFKDSDILSLEADGAQVQKIGDMDAVLYMVLPGEEQHFTLRVGTEDFAFGGFTFLVQPVTLDQMEEIANLREAKEEMEDSYDAITDSINTILNSLDGMDSKLRNTADGLDQLNKGRGTLSAGKNRVYDEADKMLASMTDVSQSLTPVVGHLKTAKDALAETNEKLTTLSDTVDGLRPDVKDLKASLSAVRKDLDDLNTVVQNSKDDTKKLSKILGYLEDDLDDLRDDLDTMGDRTEDLSNAMNDLSKTQISVEEVTVQGHTPAEIRAYHEKAVAIQQICSWIAAQSDGKLQAPTDEESYVTFVLEHKDAIARAAAKAETGEEDTEVFQAAYQEYSTLLTEDTVKMLAYLYYNWETENMDSQLAEAEQFNKLLSQASGSIHRLNQVLKNVSTPTAKLLSSIKTLIKNANDGLLVDAQDALSVAKSLLNNVNDYDSDALHKNLDAILQTTDSLLGRADTILEQSKALSDTVTKYEPNAQEALDDAVTQVNASVKLLDDLNSFTKTFENLMKAADPDLDKGMESSLSGMSSTLRQMAGGLGATDSMRTANNAIQDLIEDKWNEYTGEKNNLLNMDSQAEMVSLTSDQNQTPNSVQLVLRSQEIKVDEDAKAAAEAAGQTKLGFWGRVARMFHDFAAIFTGDE